MSMAEMNAVSNAPVAPFGYTAAHSDSTASDPPPPPYSVLPPVTDEDVPPPSFIPKPPEGVDASQDGPDPPPPSYIPTPPTESDVDDVISPKRKKDKKDKKEKEKEKEKKEGKEPKEPPKEKDIEVVDLGKSKRERRKSLKMLQSISSTENPFVLLVNPEIDVDHAERLTMALTRDTSKFLEGDNLRLLLEILTMGKHKDQVQAKVITLLGAISVDESVRNKLVELGGLLTISNVLVAPKVSVETSVAAVNTLGLLCAENEKIRDDLSQNKTAMGNIKGVILVSEVFLPSVGGLVKIIGTNTEMQSSMCAERQLKKLSELLEERAESQEDIRHICSFISAVAHKNEDTQSKLKKVKIIAKLWNLLHAKVDPASPAAPEKSKHNESFVSSLLECTLALCDGNSKNAEAWYSTGKLSSKLLFILVQQKSTNVQVLAIQFLAVLVKGNEKRKSALVSEGIKDVLQGLTAGHTQPVIEAAASLASLF